jgi:hypothetical protein
MTACERVRAEAPGLVSLDPADPERASAYAHARGCSGCAGALRDAERLHALLAEVSPEPLPAGALARASLAIAGELRREARRRSFAAAAGAAAAFAAVLALARHASHAAADWALAAVLGAVALALAAASSRGPRVAVAGAAVTAIAAALAAGGAGPIAWDEGARCLAAELASAATVVGAAWLAVRGGGTSPSRTAFAAAAAAGALAGDAGLQVACAAHDSIPHLLAFHVAGVLVAAAAAALLRPPAPYPASAP